MILQAGDDVEFPIAGVMPEGSAREFPVGDHVVGEAATGIHDGAEQESARGVVLAIAGAIRFDIQGQGQAGSHHTDQDPLVVVAEDLSLLIPVRAAQLTNFFTRPSGAKPFTYANSWSGSCDLRFGGQPPSAQAAIIIRRLSHPVIS